MSLASSRVFKACRALLAPSKSPAATAAANAPTTATKAKPKTRAKTKTEGVVPRKPAGILMAKPVSPVLRNFLGVSEASRTDVVKRIWDHIKQNNLQNPADKKEIICDEKLKVIFDGREKVGMLEMPKLISRHFVKTA
ncbi:hypothetical protein K2173_025606 [Erythroxylum novogranatense]|uniref:DM2 domain-containing protein n=1 Tax=Erythroxylum novogranatense TaxID=1862640 RepID=A0AAV8T8U4_9ROSI|nr:hypothetical protein K2173_025606 [Erythroxylum novogranatense]